MIVFIGKGNVLVAIIVPSTSRGGKVKRVENSHLKVIFFFFVVLVISDGPLVFELPLYFFFCRGYRVMEMKV